MTNEKAKEVLQEQIDKYGQEYDAEGIEALEIAIKALEQTARIAKLVNELDLAEILPKDYDNIFYLQSVREVKEEMWRMYRFAKDVSDTLNL